VENDRRPWASQQAFLGEVVAYTERRMPDFAPRALAATASALAKLGCVPSCVHVCISTRRHACACGVNADYAALLTEGPWCLGCVISDGAGSSQGRAIWRPWRRLRRPAWRTSGPRSLLACSPACTASVRRQPVEHAPLPPLQAYAPHAPHSPQAHPGRVLLPPPPHPPFLLAHVRHAGLRSSPAFLSLARSSLLSHLEAGSSDLGTLEVFSALQVRVRMLVCMDTYRGYSLSACCD
jgi:hypothetical protein